MRKLSNMNRLTLGALLAAALLATARWETSRPETTLLLVPENVRSIIFLLNILSILHTIHI